MVEDGTAKGNKEPSGPIDSSAVPSRPIPIRLSENLHEIVTREAERREISAAQLIRDATAFYLGWTIGEELGKRPDQLASYEELLGRLSSSA